MYIVYGFVIAGIHHFKKSMPRASGREKPHTYDPIAPVARDIAAHTHLLCFDEFQVSFSSDIVTLFLNQSLCAL